MKNLGRNKGVKLPSHQQRGSEMSEASQPTLFEFHKN